MSRREARQHDTEFQRGQCEPREIQQLVDFYNKTRSHMERGHLPPIQVAPEEIPKLDRDQIIIRSCVGRLVKSFERRAA